MTVRHYSSIDTGAPVLAGSRLVDRVKLILKACLVYGYGSKPAAGWVVGHEHADGFSLGNGDGFINFVNLDANRYSVYIMESITSGAAALAEGVNRRSAAWSDGSSASERQYFYCSGLMSANSPHWAVIADEKTVIMHLGGISSGADLFSALYGAAHYFGRYINTLGLTGPAEFCSLGGHTNPGSGSLIGFPGGVYGMALRNPFTGLISQGDLARYGAAGCAYSGLAIKDTPKLLPSRLMPSRAGLMCYGAGLNGLSTADGAGLAGYLRGVIVEPTLCGAYLSNVANLLGVPNTWQTRVAALTIPNGQQWVPVFPHFSDRAFFVSLAQADWE